MNPSLPWTCPGCQQPVDSAFCPRCGERPLPPHDLSLRGVGEKALHAVTSVDAKVLRSFRELLRHPGALTQAWVAGRRMPYVAPFQLFVLANALFFALQSLTGSHIFSSTLDSHLHQQDWSEPAQQLAARRIDQLHTTLVLYAPVFDRAVVLYAKSLIILMVLPFTLLLPLVFIASRRPFMTHIAVALHLYAFLLLLFSLALLAAKAEALLGGGGLASAWVDNVLVGDQPAGLWVLHLRGQRAGVCARPMAAPDRGRRAGDLRRRDRAGLSLRAAADHAGRRLSGPWVMRVWR